MNPVRVTIPNGKAIESTHEGELNIEALPEAVRHVYIYLDLLTALSSLSDNFAIQDATFFFEYCRQSNRVRCGEESHHGGTTSTIEWAMDGGPHRDGGQVQ